MALWDRVGLNQFVGLQPWVWVQLESAEPPGPFPVYGRRGSGGRGESP